jgi:glycosyltransferase involved in cell wall biosynthesis
VEIAARASAAAGLPLYIIGHGLEIPTPDGATHLGALPSASRNQWMARAQAVFTPTLYLEPFNQVAVEAQLCGTPVISTDFGGFTETVEHGATGFRCSYLGEFVQALREAPRLDPAYIRARAEALYSLDAVKPQYQRYFERVALRWDAGWDSLTVPEVAALEALL